MTTVPTHARSAASRVFVVLIAASLVLAALVAAFLVFETQTAAHDEAERVTAATARTLAVSPLVAGALEDDRDAASAALEPYALEVTSRAGLDFITVMTPDGTRVTHPDPDEIGRHYRGTIPADDRELTEVFTGTLGPSVRTIVPVRDAAGRLVGWVAAGVTTESISETLVRRLPLTVAITAVLVLLGALGSMAARRFTRRIAGDLPPGEVRDAVSSYESFRTLGEALRAQTHEHGNRMHTAVALLELGRTDEAIEILTETSRQSQTLVDQVTAQRHGDPAVGALLLGKVSQARERGIELRLHIAKDAPSSGLSPIDNVSVIGNLIDNAFAAAAASDDRWVEVEMHPAADGGLVIAVSDSGEGVPAELREQVFSPGFSTKPAGAEGRGVGLALVRSVVTEAGGSVRILDDPSTFLVELPAPRSRR